MDLNLSLSMSPTESGKTDYDVIILGGGPAGSSAAIYTARADLDTLVIDKALTSGALGMTHKIANYPGIPGEISGAELVRLMRNQAESFGAEFTQQQVIGVDLSSDWKMVHTGEGMFRSKALIIATGSMGRQASLPGEEAFLGRGVSYCATCDAAFFRDRDVAVVGFNEEAVEEALFLTKFVRRLHFVSPKRELQAPHHDVRTLTADPRVELHLGARPKAVVGNSVVNGLEIVEARERKALPVAGVFLYLQGNKPITDFLMDLVKLGENGCIVVDKDMQTNVPGVYAAGDVVCGHVKQAVIAAAAGAIAGIAVDKYTHQRSTMRIDWS
ncbi:MAG TPA: thioredoxin reductase [Anaerolineae bacterium]|nr:thioredoxin reductase [Anaerolineae bacterium]